MSTTSKDYVIEKTIFINASCEKVWDYLTNKDKLGVWFHIAAENLTEGQNYSLLSIDRPGEHLLGGKVLEFNPPHRLVTTFTHKWMNHVETIVTWDLFPVHGGTRLQLTHSGFEKTETPFKLAQDHDEGWDEHLTKLRTLGGAVPVQNI